MKPKVQSVFIIAMENKTINTALAMGFHPVSNGVFEGRLDNIQQEIDLLKSIVADAKKNPFFRQLSTQIINSFPCQHKNYDCYVYAIAKWVRENIKYIKDITGYETLQTPQNTLKIGGGDCDDHAILVATLLNAIGIKTTFKIVGKNGKYKHIYVIATTPKGKKWVVDTTEENFFYPVEDDEEYEMEILQELEGLEELGWGFKIKFKPKKFIKRATGGIRRPKKFIKQFKKKPLAFINKRFRQIIPKPIKASRRAFSPIIKPIKKIEKINPIKIKKFKPLKAIKRATASKSIDEAGAKAVLAVLAAKAAMGATGAGTATAGATGATAGAAGATAGAAGTAAGAGASAGTAAAGAAVAAGGAGLLTTAAQKATQIATGVGTTLATNYITSKLQRNQTYSQPIPPQPPPSFYYREQSSDPLKNPVIIAVGILVIGMIMMRR